MMTISPRRNQKRRRKRIRTEIGILSSMIFPKAGLVPAFFILETLVSKNIRI